MAKRLLDIVVSLAVLSLAGLPLAVILFLVWRQDGHSPFYRAPRVGRRGREFTMVKVRSMVVAADATGVNSTAAGDPRITPLGHFIRRYKIDELSQFWNVLKGDMSVVGPRPNTWKWGVELYTPEEKRLLDLRPGITDFASIVFYDEGKILEGAAHADLTYNQIIRPWKSRLSLVYRDHVSVPLHLALMALTFIAVISRPRALKGVTALLERLGADRDLIEVARRVQPLYAAPPPGGDAIFTLDGAPQT